MDFFAQPARDLANVELAVRQALEHASALGDHATATELTAILQGISMRAAGYLRGSVWERVAAGVWLH